jgi:tRNA dimethylallyltransferase
LNCLIVILGPTGIGKTALSVEIAQHLNCEIISADSRQIYKELRVGTAVPEPNELQAVKHHFIGNKSIFDYYNASLFEEEVLETIEILHKKNPYILLTGGSGMYIDAVVKGIDYLPTIDMELRNDLLEKFKESGIDYLRRQLKLIDPDYYKMVDLKNPKRMLKGLEVTLQTGIPYSKFRLNQKKTRPFRIIQIGLEISRDALYQRIDNRVDKMIAYGLVEEARQFYEHKNLNSLNSVGYKELFAHFDGEYSLEKAIELIKRNSRHYAKRQLSWFKRDVSIKWFEPTEKEIIIEYITFQMTEQTLETNFT